MSLVQTCQELVDAEGLQEVDIFYYLKIHTSLKDSEINEIILRIDFAPK